MKPSLRWIAVLLLLGIALGVVLFRFKSPNKRQENLALYRRLMATQHLVAHLAQTHSPSQTLILSNPFTQEDRENRRVESFESAAIEGVQKAFKNQVPDQSIIYPELKPGALENPESFPIPSFSTTPISFLLAPRSFDSIRTTHPNHTLWVSLIGLPWQITQTPFWQSLPPPALALLLPDLKQFPSFSELQSAFTSGKIVSMILTHPNAPPDSTPPVSDEKEEFERYFLLVTSENLQEIHRQFPNLFP